MVHGVSISIKRGAILWGGKREGGEGRKEEKGRIEGEWGIGSREDKKSQAIVYSMLCN